jgi:hypothetical protein
LSSPLQNDTTESVSWPNAPVARGKMPLVPARKLPVTNGSRLLNAGSPNMAMAPIWSAAGTLPEAIVSPMTSAPCE